ncbi:MAG: hypothetical protein CMJ95_10740 [Planctomycetes bacterium]|nr:hypothetical protein [Planctomycetota bacterium]
MHGAVRLECAHTIHAPLVSTVLMIEFPKAPRDVIAQLMSEFPKRGRGELTIIEWGPSNRFDCLPRVVHGQLVIAQYFRIPDFLGNVPGDRLCLLDIQIT